MRAAGTAFLLCAPALAFAQAQQQQATGPLTLPQLQELARQNDPRTAMARAQVDNAQGKRDEVRWALFPKLETQVAIAGPTPEARFNKAPPDHPTSLLDVTSGSKCWFCGDLGIGIGGSVTRAYWGYQTARGARDTVVQVRSRIAAARQRAQRLLAEQSDQISKSDLMKIDYLAEEIEARTAEANKNAALAITGIRLLIGKAPEEAVDIAQQELPQPPPQPNENEMLRRALERRPEARAAAEQVAARRAAVDVERAKLYPDIALVGGATFNYTSSADQPHTPFAYNPYNQRSAFVALGLQTTFDIPQKLARIRQAEAELRDAMAQQRGAEHLVRLEVRQALGDLDEARQRVARYTSQSNIGKQLAVQAGLAFDSGLGEARELLEDVLLWARADGEKFKALFDAQIAWASLQKATGGL
ncbi:MAG: TolC family protein [Deltaproteobacteria bacterium]|nr:MAG: TolC family protein [Deltaproteobacteria bacterium]